MRPEQELLASPPDTRPVPPVPGWSGWWDASDPSSVGMSIENHASTWRDRAPAKRDLTQATDGNRPWSGGRMQAGRNVLASEGKVSNLAGSVPLTALPFTVFLVAMNSQTDAVQRTCWSGFVTAGLEWGRVYRPSSNAVAIYAGATVASPRTWEAGRPRVISATFNGASSSLSVDGLTTAGNSGGAGNSATQGVFGLGLSESWMGWIGELIVYDAVALTGAQIALVEAYLRQKWGLA